MKRNTKPASRQLELLDRLWWLGGREHGFRNTAEVLGPGGAQVIRRAAAAGLVRVTRCAHGEPQARDVVLQVSL